jgi:hypothetical protein
MESNVFIPFTPVLNARSMQAYIDAKVSEELLNEALERFRILIENLDRTNEKED